MENLYHALDLVLDKLALASVPYALIGGIAVRAYAIPRNTNDIDIVVSVGPGEIEGLLGGLRDHGFEVPEPFLKGWVDRVKGMPVVKCKVYLAGCGIDIDFFLVESPFQRSIINRRARVEVDGRDVWIASAEDLVLLKLLASRPRDRLDVDDLLFIHGQLDIAYLRHWAGELGLEMQLDEALANSGQA